METLMNEIKELKATAYDVLANIEFFQKKLQEINGMIMQKNKELDKVKKKKEDIKK